ncbi:MAG: sugar phosphate isomerase/epimerase family protein [Planctomycetia bacterium]|nr:sugar phosphate isomerase/epimerase family protein [Planctomycetia bacterium]
MQLGFLTNFSEGEARLAAELGFDSLEVASGSWKEQQLATKAGRKKIAAETHRILASTGVGITAIAHYDCKVRPAAQRIAKYRALIDLAGLIGIDCIATMAGNVPDKTLDENVAIWKKTFKTVASMAEKAGIKIAFENWPGLLSAFPPVRSVNFAFTPEAWDKMFDAVPSPALGLEFDPSHLVWQGIDYLAAAKKYISRIHHVHAKDTEILDDVLSAVGSYGSGWWRYRIPGFGQVDWPAFVSTLKEGGYDGGVAIEHEDPVFAGARRVEGLRLGYNHLRPIICA